MFQRRVLFTQGGTGHYSARAKPGLPSAELISFFGTPSVQWARKFKEIRLLKRNTKIQGDCRDLDKC